MLQAQETLNLFDVAVGLLAMLELLLDPSDLAFCVQLRSYFPTGPPCGWKASSG